MTGQRQDAALEQIRDLIPIAVAEGMYDAADYLAEVVARVDKWLAEVQR